jgi:hypothetical protein
MRSRDVTERFVRQPFGRKGVRPGLTGVSTHERPVDVGVTQPEQLVSYRLGQPLFASWLDTIGPARAESLARQATATIRPIMRPYRRSSCSSRSARRPERENRTPGCHTRAHDKTE